VKKKFLGVPVKDFEKAGREQPAYLLTAGLISGSKVDDVGCDVLRRGYWLIHFLNPGNCYGIDPRRRVAFTVWTGHTFNLGLKLLGANGRTSVHTSAQGH
jgi:hypothetical protein